MKAAVLALLLALAGCSSSAGTSAAAASSAKEETSAAQESASEASSEAATGEVAAAQTAEVNGAGTQEGFKLPEQQFSRLSELVKTVVNVYDVDFTTPFDAKELTSMQGVKVTQSDEDKLISNSYIDDGYCKLSVTIDENNKVTRISDNQSNYWGIMTANGIRRGLTEQEVLDIFTKENIKYEKETFNQDLWMYYYLTENDDYDYPQAVYTITCGKNGVLAVDVTLMKFDEYYFTAEDLSKLASNYYYYSGAKEWPPYYNMQINLDGTFTIQLLEDAETHTATWATYKVNRMGKGIDVITNQPVNFMDYVQ